VAEDVGNGTDIATDDLAGRYASPLSESLTASIAPVGEGGQGGGDANEFVVDDLAAG